MIYFIQNTGTGHIKIGYTSGAVGKRVAELQTGASHRLRPLYQAPGDKAAEGHIHNRFASRRLVGEWFDITAAEAAAVAAELHILWPTRRRGRAALHDDVHADWVATGDTYVTIGVRHGVSATTVSKILRGRGVHANRRISEGAAIRSKIVAEYAREPASSADLAARLGVKAHLIDKALRSAGVDRRGAMRQATLDRDARIEADYLSTGSSARDIAARLGVTQHVVNRALLRRGHSRGAHIRTRAAAIAAAAVAEYKRTGQSAQVLASRLGVHHSRVYAALASAGLGYIDETEHRYAAIVADYEATGDTGPALAARHGVCRTTVSAALRSAGICRARCA